MFRHVPEHVPSGGAWRPRTHRYDGRDRRCKPSGLHGRGVNRVSAEGKHCRSRWPKANTAEVENRRIGIAEAESGKTCLARSGRVPDLYRGKVLRCATVSRQIDSLPPEGRVRDAGRMAVEPRARFLPRGKVLLFHGKSIHFPPRIQHCSS